MPFPPIHHGILLPPLLSPKPLAEYDADSFASYVRSLFAAPARKAEPRIRLKKPDPAPQFSRTKQGRLSVKKLRKPIFWLTHSEFAAACLALGCEQDELSRFVEKKKAVLVASPEDGRKLTLEHKLAGKL